MPPPDASGGVRYRALAAETVTDAGDQAAPMPAPRSRRTPLETINAAFAAFQAGRASYADTLAAYRAAGMTEHQATVALSIAIASTQPGTTRMWWRRHRAERHTWRWR